MKKSTKLFVFLVITACFTAFNTDHSFYDGTEVFSGDTNKTGNAPIYPVNSTNYADSVQNQGRGDGTQPKEINIYDIPPDSIVNTERKEVPIGKPPQKKDSTDIIESNEVPIGNPPMGKDSMDIIKSIELPVINDGSVIKAQPAEKEK